jgi:hypothetical protein
MPVSIICIEPDYPNLGVDLEAFWVLKTKLEKPEYCSVLKCIESPISFCRVRKQGEESDYLVPLCTIHGTPSRVSEVYDYHLAQLPKVKRAYMAYRYQLSNYFSKEPEMDFVLFANRKIRDAFAEMYGLQKRDILLPVDERPKRKDPGI